LEGIDEAGAAVEDFGLGEVLQAVAADLETGLIPPC